MDRYLHRIDPKDQCTLDAKPGKTFISINTLEDNIEERKKLRDRNGYHLSIFSYFSFVVSYILFHWSKLPKTTQ